MPTYWNLRQILDVNPEQERNCVGFAPSKGRRCRNIINRFDLPAASRLLDQMDRSKQLIDAIDDLKELAALLLCKGVHNNLSRPEYSQVNKVSSNWKVLVKEEDQRLKEHEQKEAERRRRNLRAELAKIKSKATEVKVGLEEDQLDMVRTTKLALKPTAAHNNLTTDDPFQESSLSRPNIFTKIPPINQTNNKSILSGSSSSAPTPQLSVREEKIPESIPSDLPHMPSPPTHEPYSPIKGPRIAITEQQETGSSTAFTPETNPFSKFAFAFGSKSTSSAPFQFETPTKVKTIRIENLPSSDMTNSAAISGFSFGTSASSTTSIPENERIKETKRIPLKEKASKPLNVALSAKAGTSTYNFGFGDEKKFEFEASSTPKKSSIAGDSTAHSALQFRLAQPEENDPVILSTPIQSTGQAERSGTSSTTTINSGLKSKDTPAHMIASLPNDEDHYGYANVTPNSTRYATYLPARQRHGLITPPETPENMMGVLSQVTKDADYFRDEERGEAESPMPKVTRKPVPQLPAPRVEDEEPEQNDGCAACGKKLVQGVRNCECAEGYEEKDEVKSGCLQRFGLRRLKEMIGGKVKAVRGRIAKNNEGSPISSDGVVQE